ncbi:type IV secretory system conjugative DNA transfer family protein [Coleofasciculus sp. LEGE 07081]|uniref:type IV secretory system conjugative DNA transfer family protein n=1 Tax=unclassified Coleofasciculus TaxID=2692782 RepID=UPI0034DB67D2
MLIVMVALFGIMQLFGGDNKKGKIATSFWGGAKEKNTAKKKAVKQIKAPERNSAALYIGMPPDIRKALNTEWATKGLISSKNAKKKPPASSTLYLPDVQRGTAVIGAAGSGKTFSVIDPMVRSALDQGFPACIYDFKYPAQTKRAVAYALKRGYTVRVFAPGFPESDTCNPLDLIKNEEDAIAAGQLAQVINRNIGGAGKGGDKFFEDAGDALTEGIFLLTKAVETLTGDRSYCDLMMAQAILSLTSLPARLEAALPRLNVWTTRPLTQLISVKDSEKTAASIVGTAQKTFQRFLKKDFVGAFCGQTTLPLDIDGKQLVVFGLDRNNRDIVSPLLAAILHMVVTRNVSRTTPRRDPLITVLGELPTMYLPQLVNWLNENREDGFCGILGFQNISQLEHKYGKEIARAVIGGCATKFIFNPQDPESAKIFADLLGEVEIEYKSKSKSSGKGGSSTSVSDQKQKRHLMEAASFGKLGTGRAVILNPAYQRESESYIPLLQQVKVPKIDIEEQKWAENQWDRIRDRLSFGAVVTDDFGVSAQSNAERSQQLEERRNLAEQLFPLPEGDNSSTNLSNFF